MLKLLAGRIAAMVFGHDRSHDAMLLHSVNTYGVILANSFEMDMDSKFLTLG